VAFIAGLMEGRAPFVAYDNPHATPLTIHILAAVAQHEREASSARTRAALAVAKARGTRLGNPDAGPARELAAAATRAAAALSRERPGDAAVKPYRGA
jgi:DNA invertase Pin-like site-specific DNA recombinase